MGKVLIIGAAGFIGSHTARTLLDMREEVVAYDFLARMAVPVPPTFLENLQYRHDVLLRGAEFVRGSIQFKDALRRQLLSIRPDYVVHLASSPSATQETEEAFDGIVSGTVNILEALRELPQVQKFVYVSSSMVYGDFTQTPMPENGVKEPKEIYGGMKLAAELLVKAFARRYGIPYTIVRPSAVYGPTNNNRSILQIFVENAIQGHPITVTNPETTYLDFSYVKDVARGLALTTLSPNARNEEFNITRGEGRSLAEAVTVLQQFFADLQVQVRAEEEFRPSRGALDVSKARRLVGYDPQYPLEAGLAEYIEFVRAHNPSIASRVYA